MKELSQPLSRVLREPLADARLDQIWQRVAQRRRGRTALLHGRLTRAALLSTCALLAALAAWRSGQSALRAPGPTALGLRNGEALVALAIGEHEVARTLVLTDGTRITLTPGSRLTPRACSAERFEVSVECGRVRFEVQPQGRRRFSVLAADVMIRVVGTAFEVDHALDHVAVTVEHGRVRVGSPSRGQRLVGAGQTWLEPLQASAARPEPPIPTAVPALASGRSESRAPTHTTQPHRRGHAAAKAGALTTAHAQIGERGFEHATREAPSADALLELADVARGAGHAREAALALRELLARFPGDSHAGLAALTLARIELDALSQPDRAARSLTRALELGLPAALQEDARARLVEALSKAGQAEAAQRAAAQYQSRYPEGRWTASVRRWVAAP